jgi:hypothetical protein
MYKTPNALKTIQKSIVSEEYRNRITILRNHAVYVISELL